MCGIAGVLDRSGREVDPALVRAMTATLVHRGPDDEGVWTDGAVGLGHRRLSIRDLSAAGHQPMQDAGGRVTVTYNGELYNETELRRELEREHGVRFRSTCDTEVIPEGYRVWGEGIFERLEGMYALALWDADAGCLYLARDGVGVKPLYVAEHGGRVRFASELKGILADPDQPRRLDPGALHAFLAQGYVAPDRSLLQGVGQVPPGTLRRYDRAGVRDRTLWRPTRRPEIHRVDDAVDAFLAAWPAVLSAMLVSDVPVGTLQSGGIDSSLVTLGLAGHPDVEVFAAAFAERSHDESEQALEVARAGGRRHHRVPVAEEDVAAAFRAVVRHFDGQLADSSGLAVYGLARAVRRHTKVVLSGDGADEFFAGYPTYRATRLAAGLRRVAPQPVLEALGRRILRAAAGSEERLPAAAVLGRFLLGAASPGEPHAEWRRLLPRHEIAGLYGPELSPLAGSDALADYARAISGAEGSLLDRCLLADQRHYLPSDMLMKVDAMSMAHGLEVRVPFLHPRIVDLAARLDGGVLTSLVGPDKRVLREALARLGGPPHLVAGPKRGFNVPVTRLLTGPLAGLAARLLDAEADRLAPWLAPEGVRRLWREQREGRGNHGYAIWALLSLAVWLEDTEVAAA